MSQNNDIYEKLEISLKYTDRNCKSFVIESPGDPATISEYAPTFLIESFSRFEREDNKLLGVARQELAIKAILSILTLLSYETDHEGSFFNRERFDKLQEKFLTSASN